MADHSSTTKLRASQGGAFESRGKFFARVTTAPQTREAILLPWCTELDAAKARAGAMQALVNRLRAAGKTDLVDGVLKSAAKADAEAMAALGRAVDGYVGGALELSRSSSAGGATGPLTFKRFAERWTTGDLHREFPDHIASKKTADEDAGRLARYVYPVVKELPLASFTLDHALEVMRRVPRERSGSTRRHVAQLLVRILSLAVYPCRHIKASPLPRGFLPKVGAAKALAFLYPDEDARLMACKDVPLVHRLLYGFLTREGMRSDEAQQLQWRDVDLLRGAVRLDVNKTDDARGWVLGEDVAAALGTWRAMNPSAKDDDLVFPGLRKPYCLAVMFRAHLVTAKVDRAELFERSMSRRRIRVHDCRATFVTLALAAGQTETWVADRTGHKSSQMINRYRRAARSVEEMGLGWLAPLDAAIPELAAANPAADTAAAPEAEEGESPASARVPYRFRRRDSNPRKRNQNPLSCL